MRDDSNSSHGKGAAVRQLGVFAKYWQPGVVKTRLAAKIGNAAASRIYRAFVKTTLKRLEGVADRRVVAFTPADRCVEFERLAAPRWLTEAQSGGDLGQRMSHFFTSAFRNGASKIVLIGSDSPTLPAELVDQAFDLLQRYAVVLGPSDDGGYYLVGAAGEVPPIFDGIDWSTADVWPQTIRRLEKHAVDYATLPQWYDVDEIDDLQRLRDELESMNEANDLLDHLRQLLTVVNEVLNDGTPDRDWPR